MAAVRYDSYTEARAHLKDLLDAAAQGQVATVRRDTEYAAVVNADRLRYALARLCPSRAEVVAENGGWSVFLPGLPVAADGATLDEALDETIEALREYAEDWQNRLRDAPNHRENWGLVQLIELSDNEQLREWLAGGAG
ncbi:prevent-host-death protein [Nocardia sp. NPDC058499]|uniref:prevent-host-death protein n=1 Tax=Nocardia sp. NPDC058499 TaxID=3346530 RepID=UPI0036570B15